MDTVTKLGHFLCWTFLLASIHNVYSVTVTCNSNGKFANYCLVRTTYSPNAVLTRIAEESPRYTCVPGENYGYRFYSNQLSYIFVLSGCGGTFSVTVPSTPSIWSQWADWADWAPCSVTCGLGSQYRTRLCSTGRNLDCSSNENESTLTRPCTARDCITNPIIIRPSSWNNWGGWGPCSLTCGGGSQTRFRSCRTGIDTDCSINPNDSRESRECNAVSCTTNAGTGSTINNPNCGWSQARFGYRVIGGSEAGNCQYPWMVLVYNGRKGTACGGTIIDSRHILTAAHCVSIKAYLGQSYLVGPRHFRIYSGSSRAPIRQSYTTIRGSIRRYASNVKRHEQYDSEKITNDIAIITLTEPIVFDRCHQPICLPSAQDNSLATSNCQVTGWGTTSNSRYASANPDLLFTRVNVKDPSECVRYYATSFDSHRELCVGSTNAGSCSGDSGGPLACPSQDGRFVQHGIVSSGGYRHCGDLPSLYTKLTNYVDWIHTNTNAV